MATPDWVIKQNDNSPALGGSSGVILKDGDGDAVNLAGCTVVLNARNKATGALKIDEGSCTVVVAASGTVQYAWQSGDTSTPGDYDIEWQVTDASDNVQTFPTEGYDLLRIEAELS